MLVMLPATPRENGRGLESEPVKLCIGNGYRASLNSGHNTMVKFTGCIPPTFSNTVEVTLMLASLKEKLCRSSPRLLHVPTGC